MTKIQINLHGVKHENVEIELENKIFLLDPPCKIITGNSKKMQDIVIKFLKKHDYKYMVGDAWNRGYIMVF